MGRYLARRLLAIVPVLFVLSLVSFTLIKLIPGDPAAVLAGINASPVDIGVMRHQMGLDRPLHVQYLRFVERAVAGDFGRSVRTTRPVRVEIAQGFSNTFQLATVSIVLATLVGLSLGCFAALRRYTIYDTLAMMTATLGVSAPVFWVGLMLIVLFSADLRLLPAAGNVGWASFILPAVALGLNSSGIIARMTRAGMVDTLSEDYVRTARSKGVTETAVVIRHALKNAMIPAITVLGLQYGYLLAGAAITETVFAWPGLGRLMVDSIGYRDYPVIQAGVLVVGVGFTLINLLADLGYAVVDPRIRYG
ncbi:MAG TPA: ABC transporter permease [bacterium]|nr:ABC transporter permease [bacterium]